MKVQYRYEHLSREGKVFTQWIDVNESFTTTNEAEDYIKSKPKVFNKLNYEYRICNN